VQFIVADNIECCGLMVKALKFAGSSFKLLLITTTKCKLFVKVSFGNKKTVYSAGWKNRPQSTWRNSSLFMINESSGNTEIQMSKS